MFKIFSGIFWDFLGFSGILNKKVERKKEHIYKIESECLCMYPLDYEKFLWAMKREKLSKEIKKHFLNNEAMPEALNKVAMELYQQYFIIGGMPAAIRTYLETESYIKVQPVQNDILSAFIADMSKYANPTTSIKIRACYNSIPAQLAKGEISYG